MTHWLLFDYTDGDHWSSGEIANLFVLALWLVKSTKAHVAFRFKIGFGAADGESGFSRLYDRVQWIEGSVAPRYSNEDIALASQYFRTLLTIGKYGRLNHALVLTLQACWQGRWQGALVLFAAAAETLLTWSSKQGVTHRLATTYACLVESDETKRDAAYQEFKTCYDGRSDVVHGRGTNIADDERLKLVIRWAEVVRGIWCSALTVQGLIDTLECSDEEREQHFSPCVSRLALGMV